MEKEIQVRKKRFAAFWAVALLVCGLVLPMMAGAEQYPVEDSLQGKTVKAGDTILYASETTGTYSVYYRDWNWNYTQTGSAEYGNAYTVLSDTEAGVTKPAGSTFAGWCVDNVFESGTGLPSVVLSPIATYAITYELNGGTNSGSNPSSYVYGSGVDSFEDAEKTGHTFEGWYSDADCMNEVQSIDYDATGDVRLYAKFTVDTYQIQYEANGGTHENTVSSYTYGASVDSFAAAAKEGYTFEGWYSDADFTTKMESIAATDTGDITLYAKFTRSVTYVLNGGTNADSNPVSYVEGVGASLAAASKPGFVFDGWCTDEGLTAKIESIGTDATGDLKLYARFVIGTIEPYTYDLKAGVQYQLGSARQVSGDNSVYSEGATFFVPSDGSYTFE